MDNQATERLTELPALKDHEPGTVYRSDDNGETWTPMSLKAAAEYNRRMPISIDYSQV